MAVVWKKLAREEDVITKALLTNKGDIIIADATPTPIRLGIGADNQILRVATDLPNWEDMGAPAAHTLNSHDPAGGAVDFNLQQATDLVVFTVTDETARDALAAAATEVGQLCFATAELSLAICIESSA